MTVFRTQTRQLGDHGKISGDILLIEDQRSLAQMAAKMLHDRWGCRVLIATNMAQVRTILAQKKQHFFVAVSDLNLPDAHHGEVIDELIASNIPVIAMTGEFNPAMHSKIMGKGVVDYVLKNSINAYEYVVELVGRFYRNLQTSVLVVDDSEAFRTVLVKMLRTQGLQVITAHDGMTGLKLLQQHPEIKLVLVDYEMPGMDGSEFLLQVRRKVGKDKLAVIGIAGSGNQRLSVQFLKLGANDFIFKPFTYEELSCRVSQNLDMQESLETMRHVAYHDFLTGLLNRRAYFEQGGQLFDKKVKAGEARVVAMMDIDFFKKINDIYGHDGGDVALMHFSALMSTHFKHDLLARMGGEEFGLLFANADTAAEQCEAFRLKVEQTPVQFGDTMIAFTISVGISQRLASSLDEMLIHADENLYKAKNGGRNRVVSS